MIRRRPSLLVIFIVVFSLIAWAGRWGNGVRVQQIGKGKEETPAAKPCTEHLDWLEPYQFTSPIKYVSRDIIAYPSLTSERPSLTILDTPLFHDFTTLDLSKSTIVEREHCLPPLALEVPSGLREPVDASNMIFGMRTTIGRLKDTAKHRARWLPNTGARLYAIVTEDDEMPAKDEDLQALEKQFKDQGMDVTIMQPVSEKDSLAQRYFSLVGIMYSARNDMTEWIICIDDDTFFPSMHALSLHLKKYDSSKPQYVGSLSEVWGAVNQNGLMGFGGAGILLSRFLAKVIYDHMDECRDNIHTAAGDVSIMDCIYRFSSTKLTHVPALHQVDMHGDLSGFYESGREMLSLHQWEESSAAGYKLEMEKMHLVASICDSCFLQRWQFSKELILSNGFSISYYPEGHVSGQKPGGLLRTGAGVPVPKINFEEMEHTWEGEFNALHSLAPLREKMNEDTKIGYKLLDSMIIDSDTNEGKKGDVVRQVYFKKGGGNNQDTVMVLNWRAGERPTV